MSEEPAAVVLAKFFVQHVERELPLAHFLFLLGLVLLGYIEVNQLRSCDSVLDLYHYVLRLDVSMGDLLLVEIVNCVSHLIVDLGSILIGHCAELLNVVLQVDKSIEVLHDAVATRSLFICVELKHLWNVRMVKLLEKVVFVQSIATTVLAFALLYRKHVSLKILNNVDAGVSPKPKLLADLIVLVKLSF